MVAPGNGIIIAIITLGIMVSATYALGRIHQWYRHGETRDAAYRQGYDEASRSLFGMVRDGRAAAHPEKVRNLHSMVRATGLTSDRLAGRDIGTGRRRLTARKLRSLV
ncbi:hypothetical protein [Actinoplanes sp. NPDC049265]|uniref:hypothetical protein n=1 Tax=Actinoplanes sp. NPDC049265 TaxID=3363902 RepID=UPI00371BD3A5